MKILITTLSLLISFSIHSKELPMREGYRQLKLSSFPKLRTGMMSFIYSEASSSNNTYLKKLDKTQTLMMETIIDSLKMGRVPMANSIWKKFVRTLHKKETSFDINNIFFNIIEAAYLRNKFALSYRAKLYKVLNEKVVLLEQEKDEFKDLYKRCKDSSHCSYDTKDELDRTNDLWKRRTKVFDKEMKKAKSRLEDIYDEQDGFSRLTLHVSKLFFGSAEAIISAD